MVEVVFEKPEGQNSQGVSAKFKKPDVNSQWNGVVEVVFDVI